MISGILPRLDYGGCYNEKIQFINNNLKSLCRNDGINFVDYFDKFNGMTDLFRPDGVHLNAVGSARLGRLLNSSVSFLGAGERH